MATCVQAEAAQYGSDALVQVMLDITNALEAVPRDQIIKAAEQRGYPTMLLKTSLVACRRRRTVCIWGANADTVVATIGITAFSGFATSELQLLMLQIILPLMRE